MNLDCVQETWNRFENKIMNVIDELVPNVPHSNDTVSNTSHNKSLKNLYNVKRRLLRNKNLRNNFEHHLK